MQFLSKLFPTLKMSVSLAIVCSGSILISCFDNDSVPTDESVHYRGTLTRVYEDRFEPVSSAKIWVFQQLDDGALHYVTFDAPVGGGIESGSVVSFSGRQLTPTQILASPTTIRVEIEPSVLDASTTSNQERVLVVPVRVQGRPSYIGEECALESLQSQLFGQGGESMGQILSTLSGGVMSVDGAVSLEVIEVPDVAGDCAVEEWSRMARGLYLEQHGEDGLSDYNRVVYLVPECGQWTGRSQLSRPMARSSIWIADTRMCDLGSYLHQMGHALGLRHAGLGHLECEGTDSEHICGETGDRSDFMGDDRLNTLALNAPHLMKMGWRTVGDIEEYAGEDTYYHLESLDSVLSAVDSQIVWIPGRESAPGLFVSYRTDDDLSHGIDASFSGRVLVHSWAPDGGTLLLANLKRGVAFIHDEIGVRVEHVGGDAARRVRIRSVDHSGQPPRPDPGPEPGPEPDPTPEPPGVTPPEPGDDAGDGSDGGAGGGAGAPNHPHDPGGSGPTIKIKSISRKRITGTAYDADIGQEPVIVEVWIDGELAGHGIANLRLRRAPREHREVGRNHLFRVNIPRMAQGSHTVRVVVPDYDSSGAVIPGHEASSDPTTVYFRRR